MRARIINEMLLNNNIYDLINFYNNLIDNYNYLNLTREDLIYDVQAKIDDIIIKMTNKFFYFRKGYKDTFSVVHLSNEILPVYLINANFEIPNIYNINNFYILLTLKNLNTKRVIKNTLYSKKDLNGKVQIMCDFVNDNVNDNDNIMKKILKPKNIIDVKNAQKLKYELQIKKIQNKLNNLK